MANMSETVKKAASQAYDTVNKTGIFGNISNSWQNFKQSILRLFGQKHPKTGLTEDLEQYMNDFRSKIDAYFKKNMPDEDYSSWLDEFSDKFSDYIRNFTEGSEGPKKKSFTDKFYEFSSNITDYIHQGLYGHKKAEDMSLKERFSKFIGHAGEYLQSNFTTFKDYVANLLPGGGRVGDWEKEETLPFVMYHHHHYAYTHDKNKDVDCTETQIDKCGHKCMEDKKVLCGCFREKKADYDSPVDCVCAESDAMCEIQHTHTPVGEKKGKKESL